MVIFYLFNAFIPTCNVTNNNNADVTLPLTRHTKH